MFYMKSNSRSAVAVPDSHDVRMLEKFGVEFIARKAKEGSIKHQAVLQRLVNGNYLAEGNY